MDKEKKQSYRELELLDAIRRCGGFAKNSDLATSLNVSEETVRRTVKALSKSGAIARVRGGAYLVGEQTAPSYSKRIEQFTQEKRLVAQKLVLDIVDGMTLFLDVGSTTAFIAEELRARENLCVVTNSVQVGQTLVGHNGNSVHLLGGEMQAVELGAFGHVAEQQARSFCYDCSVISADALHPRHGFLYFNRKEAELASVAIENSDMTIAAITHQKYAAKAPHAGFAPESVDRLVVDRPPPGALLSQLDIWGITLASAKEEVREC
ncbi:DeoR/GlpR family DNA-binding transcription regulator [Aliiroseovarius sp. 2305UL8-7]|uniref:DeoR/GlpR family DNA-binding transcription regulator n=1 Tax=Aliiroseovarius conchicola TaxID=3121637 RepID=UPI0035286649